MNRRLLFVRTLKRKQMLKIEIKNKLKSLKKKKMSHQDIIIVIGIITFVSTVGVIGCIRSIPVTTPTPTNVLRRQHHDIELQNVVEPIRSNFIRDLDLSSLPEYPQAMVNQYTVR